MTHLGSRVHALVDGRLTPDARERAHAHLAACAQCRSEVAAERRVRELLCSAPVPAPSPDLVAGLLALGGPQGPLPPRRTELPGTAVPAPAAWGSRRVPGRGGGRRRDVSGPGRRGDLRRRVAASAAGALALASVGLVGLLLLGSLAPAQPGTAVAMAPGALGATGAAARSGVLTPEQRAGMREDGWLCPESLPGGMRLVTARATTPGGVPTLELLYSDGSSTFRVVEQRGRVDPEDAVAFSSAVTAGARAAGSGQVPWHGLWQNGDVVVGVVTDAPQDVVEQAVPVLTAQDAPTGLWDRVERGAHAVTALLADR